MKDDKTPEQKSAANNGGGMKTKDRGALDAIWDEVQATNRAAGPWGALKRAAEHQ